MRRPLPKELRVDVPRIKRNLIRDEGVSYVVYEDGDSTSGGRGHNMKNKVPPPVHGMFGESIPDEPTPLPEKYRKIGTKIPAEAIELMFDYDVEVAIGDAFQFLPSPSLWEQMGEARREVLVQMSYILGINRLKKFERFRDALINQDYDKAAAEMLNSDWHKLQAPARSLWLSNIMKSGDVLDFGDN